MNLCPFLIHMAGISDSSVDIDESKEFHALAPSRPSPRGPIVTDPEGRGAECASPNVLRRHLRPRR